MTEKTPVVTGETLIRVLKRVGYVVRRQKGSHVHLFREHDHRRVTVPVHKGKNIPVGTFRSILRDADLTMDEFRELL